MISYAPFWTTLIRKELTQYRLIHDYHISNSLLQRLRTNQHISTRTLQKLVDILDCSLEEIVEITPDGQELPEKTNKIWF